MLSAVAYVQRSSSYMGEAVEISRVPEIVNVGGSGDASLP